MSLKILLADDSLTAQNMGKKILTEAGYEVVAVSNGAQALKKIAAEPPDLVVLDVYMPGYSGVELCERMRNSRETARTPIVLSVGKMEAFKPEEVTRVRADGLIVKPFEATELLAVVKKLEEKVPPQPKRRSAQESVEEQMVDAAPSAPSPAEPEFETPHPAVEIPQEMASTPAIGMDLIPEEAPEPPAPAAPFEFEVERDPEPVTIEEGPRMASAAGLSGVFEMEPKTPPAEEKPAAPAPAEQFERFSVSPEASAASQPPPEPAAGAGATTVADDLAPDAPQMSGEAECAALAGPPAETWSVPPADPSPLEYAAEDFNHLQPEASAQSAPPPAPEVLSEFSSWDELATSLPADTPELSADTVLHSSAAQFTAAGPVWVAEEAEIEPHEFAVPLHQQMQRQGQASEILDSELPASPAMSAEASLPRWEIPEPARPTAELPTFREPSVLPRFEPSPRLPVEHTESQSAYTGLASSRPDSPAVEAQPAPAPAPETQNYVARATDFMPPATVPVVTETAVDPARIASIVERALERLKPELIAAVTRELEKKNQ